VSGDRLCGRSLPSQNRGVPLGAQSPYGFRACLPWGSSGCRALYVGWSAADWFTAVSRQGAAFRPVGDISIRPSPDPFESGSFSRALRPLRSSFSGAPGLTLHNAILAYRIDAGGHSCQDFAPHRDITSGVHDPIKGPAGIPSPASFRPRAFSAPRRFSPPPTSRACFIPLPRPGFVIRPGDSPDSQWTAARHRRLPPCRWDARTHRQAGCHTRARRLRGITPRIDAFHEPGG